VLVETLLRKQLGLKAHTVTKVEETDRFMIVKHRPTGTSVAALRGLPTALPEGAQCAQTAGMARSVDAECSVETALPAASSRMPPVRSEGRGLSLGGPLGASDHGAVECGGQAGSGVELAGNGSPVRIELEERGDDRETCGGVWLAPPGAAAGACHWHG
jgi:hypothetical protein